jgi:hypothetical protein
MRPLILSSVLLAGAAIAGISTLTACGGNSAPPPPPPQGTGGAGTTQMAVPPGQVLVTVAASSAPPGATVTGGGRLLGRTPFTTQVPIPAPTPGQTQTFQFTFQLPGYQPTTISASPINNTITLHTALPPMAGTPPVDPTTGLPGTGGAGGSFTVRGPPGGAIYDMHTTTSSTRVDQQCVINTLTVDIDGNHTYHSDLVVSLRGPDGEGYTLQSRTGRNPFRSHTVRRAAGHTSQGTWTLSIADQVGADSGFLRGWRLSIRCR